MVKSLLGVHWPVLMLLLLSSLIVWPVLLPGFFSHHDDLQVMRIYEMRRCIEDLQIPCRWVPDMGFGNGFPLFNYYSVLPYYIGAVLSYIFGFIGASKALFFIPLVVGGVSMYFLGKEMFGKYPGFVAAVLYMFAPYRALDSYTRGAVAESFALALIPFVFYFFLRLIKERSVMNFAGSAFSLGLFLLCHNLMTLIFLPTLGIYGLFFLYFEKFKNLKAVILAGILGIGLASFFVLPAYFEQNLVQVDTLVRMGSDYRAHFVTLDQLFFNREWGYGASEFGPNDTISFQIGWPQWWLSVAGLLTALAFYRKSKRYAALGVILFTFFLGSAFMTHGLSVTIWEKINQLKFMQFPWRFLSITIFSASLLGGLLLYYIKKEKHLLAAAVAITITTVFLNWQFFKPSTFYYSLTDQEKLTGILFEIQQQAGILDYLPKTAQEPKSARPDKPEVISGDAEVSSFESKSNSFAFKVDVKKPANIEIPVFDFPNWKVKVNKEDYMHSHNNKLGRIRLDLEPGQYQILGDFTDTPLRTAANTLSLVSVIILLVIIKSKKANKWLT